MKRKLLTLALMVMILATVAWTPPTAECFGCTAAQRQQCRSEANAEFERCMNFYPPGPGTDNFCVDQADAYQAHCLMTKGCPITPYYP